MLPTENLGFLLHHLSTTLDRQSDELLQQRLQIGFSQFKIMLALESKEGVTQKEIARKLGQTEASVSRQIKLMQHMRLLTSTVNPDNRRERYVVLTTEGAQVLREATTLLNKQFARMFDQLSKAQQQGLYYALTALDNSINPTVY